MAAAAHNPGFARRAGISTSVAREFNQADAGGQMLKQAMTAKKLRKPRSVY